jgi:hypothetical protein
MLSRQSQTAQQHKQSHGERITEEIRRLKNATDQMGSLKEQLEPFTMTVNK